MQTHSCLHPARLAAILFLTACAAPAQKADRAKDPVDELAASLEPSRLIVYKTVEGRDLRLHVFHPPGWQKTDRRTLFLTIHGGGWRGGVPRRMYPFADHFARLGMVGISLEYRLAASKPGSGALTPFDCVMDARSALRHVRTHAADLGIDPEKIVVSGASAGGHLALATALFDGVNDPADDPAISPRPAALVLLYPVIDTSAEGYGNALLGDRWRELDPVSQVRAGLPPTILFHGTGDKVTPFAGAQRFVDATRAAGNLCELVVHEGGAHGYLMFDRDLLQQTLAKTTEFLRSQGL